MEFARTGYEVRVRVGLTVRVRVRVRVRLRLSLRKTQRTSGGVAGSAAWKDPYP